jgi:myosin heavy subunit
LANLDIKQKDENIKQLEEKYNILKNETMNNGISTTTNNNDSNNNELIKIIEENNQLNKEKSSLNKELIILKENNTQISDELLKSKQENESLQNKIKKLSEENFTVNDKFYQINIKYIELEKENKNLKEISEALIEKQKNQVEKESKVDPTKYNIITNKKYKKLVWYLICKKKSESKDDKKENAINDPENNYSNYRWVTGQIIKRNQLEKFNKFESDEQKLKDLQEYIFDLQKKLERKEESISIMDYKNKKLTEANHNKTASVKGALKANLIDISKNTINNNQNKNNSATEIIQLQNEISKLKDEIKAKEKLEQGIPNNIFIKKEKYDEDSDFLDEDIRENKVGGMMDFIKSKNDIIDDANSRKSGVPVLSTKSQVSSLIDYKASERKVDEYLNKGALEENDLDIEKALQDQLKILKDEIKEKNKKYNLLSEQVKELLKNIKCDMKIKPQIVQICQIFEYSPQTINRIVTNKKKVII